MTLAQAACVRAAVRASRQWLAAGTIPGVTGQQRSMATRALLDLRLLTRPDGAVVAAWHSGWRYAWPRDSSWVAVALADTGHLADSFRVLRFLQRMQLASGTWAARYWPDGAGPVRDGRPAELDATGWVPWAVWYWAAALRPGDRAGRRQLALLWPMVEAAAGAADRALTADGLPGRFDGLLGGLHDGHARYRRAAAGRPAGCRGPGRRRSAPWLRGSAGPPPRCGWPAP